MEFSVQFGESEKYLGAHHYYFDIRHAGNYFRRVKIVVSQLLVHRIGTHLELADPWQAPNDQRFERGVMRLATRTIEDRLMAGAIEPVKNIELEIITLPEDDENVGLLMHLARGDKTCSYQESEGRDLFCTAASPNDETALPIVLASGRHIAPTSRHLCSGCDLPDTDYICSHFLHPQVSGMRAMGGPNSVGLESWKWTRLRPFSLCRPKRLSRRSTIWTCAGDSPSHDQSFGSLPPKMSASLPFPVTAEMSLSESSPAWRTY